MRAYIRVEVAHRELDAKLLLALSAAERGIDVLVGDIDQELLSRWEAPPGLFHDQSAWPSRRGMAIRDELLRRGFSITAQDEEIAMQGRYISSYCKVRFSRDSLSQLSSYYTWGSRDHMELSQAFGDSGEVLRPTGSPRVDLWTQAFDGMFKSCALPGIESGEPFILVPMAGGGPIARKSIDKGWDAHEVLLRHVTVEERRNLFIQELSQSVEQLRDAVEVLDALSQTLPQVRIVVRPHPSDENTMWMRLLRGLPNVTINSDGPISPWIRQAASIVHFGSTASLEARVARANVVLFAPNGTRDNLPALGRLARSPQGVCDIVKSDLAGAEISSSTYEDHHELLDIVSNSSGDRLAATAIAEDWVRILSLGEAGVRKRRHGVRLHSSPLQELRLRSRILGKTYVRNTIGIAMARMSTNRRWQHHLKRRQMFPASSEEALRRKLRLFQDSTGQFKDVSLHLWAPRIIRVRRVDGL